jgi:hypothetical protein
MAARGSKSGSPLELSPSVNREKATGSEGMVILIRPMDRFGMPMMSAASRDKIARSPGESSPAATMARMDLPVSRLMISTTVFRGNDLVAT